MSWNKIERNRFTRNRITISKSQYHNVLKNYIYVIHQNQYQETDQSKKSWQCFNINNSTCYKIANHKLKFWWDRNLRQKKKKKKKKTRKETKITKGLEHIAQFWPLQLGRSHSTKEIMRRVLHRCSWSKSKKLVLSNIILHKYLRNVRVNKYIEMWKSLDRRSLMWLFIWSVWQNSPHQNSTWIARLCLTLGRWCRDRYIDL